MAQRPADILRQALCASDLTARQLAGRTSVTEGRLSDYLSGRHDPGATRFLKLIGSAGYRVELIEDLDKNGLVLAELLELADALTVATSKPTDLRLPSFNELMAARG